MLKNENKIAEIASKTLSDTVELQREALKKISDLTETSLEMMEEFLQLAIHQAVASIGPVFQSLATKLNTLKTEDELLDEIMGVIQRTVKKRYLEIKKEME